MPSIFLSICCWTPVAAAGRRTKTLTRWLGDVENRIRIRNQTCRSVASPESGRQSIATYVRERNDPTRWTGCGFRPSITLTILPTTRRQTLAYCAQYADVAAGNLRPTGLTRAINPSVSKGNHNATSNFTIFTIFYVFYVYEVGTVSVGRLAVTFSTARRGLTGCGPAQSPLRHTKCNNPPINGQCTNHCIAIWWSIGLRF